MGGVGVQLGNQTGEFGVYPKRAILKPDVFVRYRGRGRGRKMLITSNSVVDYRIC